MAIDCYVEMPDAGAMTIIFKALVGTSGAWARTRPSVVKLQSQKSFPTVPKAHLILWMLKPGLV
jgi:hypothetical protein